MGSAPVLLGFVFSVMTLAWLTTYAVVIATAGRLLRVSRVQRSIEAVSGVVLVGLCARVAIDTR